MRIEKTLARLQGNSYADLRQGADDIGHELRMERLWTLRVLLWRSSEWNTLSAQDPVSQDYAKGFRDAIVGILTSRTLDNDHRAPDLVEASQELTNLSCDSGECLISPHSDEGRMVKYGPCTCFDGMTPKQQEWAINVMQLLRMGAADV